MARLPSPLVAALLALPACGTSSPAPPPPVVAAPPAPPRPAPMASAAPVASAAPAAEVGTACGPLACRRFPTAAAAFEVVLAEEPDVLAVGEAHAQKGAEGIESATHRFTRDLLPLVEGEATHVVLELIAPPGGCKQAVAKADEAQKPVRQQQAAGNQNEFIALGKAAEKLSIRPRILTPDCARFQTIADAGPDGVLVMLEMIAAMSEEILRGLIARNGRLQRDTLILAYGGAMHNDVTPREGRASWSFGPQLVEATEGRYVELDLIVPEFIKDNDSWRSFPWFEHFDREDPPDEATLFRTGDHSWVLIFGRSGPQKPQE